MKNKLLILTFAFFTLLSCDAVNLIDDPQFEEEPKIESISASSLEFSSDSASQNLSFSTNSNWAISLSDSKATPDWISVAPMSGAAGDITVTVTSDANTTTSDRNSYITIASGDISEVITVNQAAVEIYLSLDKISAEVDYSASEIELIISSNTSWTSSEIPEWITMSPTSSSGNQTITLSYQANSTMETRSAVITFTSEYGNTQTFTLLQTALTPSLTLSKSSESVSVNAGTTTFTLSSNTSWTSSEIPEWINISPTSGSGNQTITLSYQANSTTETRSAVITFTSEYGNSQTFTISQAAFNPTLTLSKSSESVSVDAGTITFSLASNTSWTSSEIPEWITMSPASGSGNQTITLSYQANSTTETRSAVITFSTEYDNKQTFEINQSANQLGDLINGGKL